MRSALSILEFGKMANMQVPLGYWDMNCVLASRHSYFQGQIAKSELKGTKGKRIFIHLRKSPSVGSLRELGKVWLWISVDSTMSNRRFDLGFYPLETFYMIAFMVELTLNQKGFFHFNSVNIEVFDFTFFQLALVDFDLAFWCLSLNGLRDELINWMPAVLRSFFASVSEECDCSRTILRALGCRLARSHVA